MGAGGGDAEKLSPSKLVRAGFLKRVPAGAALGVKIWRRSKARDPQNQEFDPDTAPDVLVPRVSA